MAWGAAALEQGQGLLQLDSDRGALASPRMGQGAEHGVDLMARPWPCGGPCGPKHDVRFDCAHGTVTCAGGQTVPRLPGRAAPWPASACDVWPQHAQGPTTTGGPGRPLPIREEEQVPQQLRAKLQPTRGRASRRQRPAVAQALSQHVAHQGRRAREKGRRQKQLDGRCHVAVSNLQVAASDEEQRQLAS